YLHGRRMFPDRYRCRSVPGGPMRWPVDRYWQAGANHQAAARALSAFGARIGPLSGEDACVIELHRILVPTDFSKHSEVALTYAAALAEKFGAELILLHVVQDLALFIPDAVAVAPPIAPPVEQFTAAARAALERVAQADNLRHLTLRREVREGTP